MMNLVLAAITSYIITAVLVNGNIFYSLRERIKSKTSFLVKNGRHLVDCRMCSGLWVSIIVGCLYGIPEYILLIYGISYFMATQER